MPLLTRQEISQLSPLFRGSVGSALVRAAMHLLAIDRANALYDCHAHLRGANFAHSVLSDLGVRYEVSGWTSVEALGTSKPFLTISNHPYGGIDGVALADLFGHLRPDYKVMVNRMLYRVSPLASTFIPVSPIGAERTSPSPDSIVGVRHSLSHLRSGGVLGLFPAGAVSDFHLRPFGVHDRVWQLPVVRLIAKARVPILPVHFHSRNSWFYYALGLIHWRVRLLRLPSELFNKRNHTLRITVGKVITVAEQQAYLATHDLESFGMWLRSKVYEG